MEESESENEGSLSAKAAKKDEKQVNISCTYTEEVKKADKAKLKATARSSSRGRKSCKSPMSAKSSPSCSPVRAPKKECKPKKPATLEGEFSFKGLDKNAKYVVSINEYNDLGHKCKNVGDLFNPKNLKTAPGVKTFKTDKKGGFEKSFKNLQLSISGRDSIINRTCLLKKVKESHHSDSESSEDEGKKKKKRKEEFVKCAVITWEPPYWAGASSKE